MGQFDFEKQKRPAGPLPGDGMTAEERYAKGMELFRAGQYAESFPYLKRACSFLGPRKDQYPDGQATLGLLYERGLGTKADPGMAMLLYKIAAKNGDQDGMTGVVRMALRLKSLSQEDCRTALDCARQLNDRESIPALERKLDTARRQAPHSFPD